MFILMTHKSATVVNKYLSIYLSIIFDPEKITVILILPTKRYLGCFWSHHCIVLYLFIIFIIYLLLEWQLKYYGGSIKFLYNNQQNFTYVNLTRLNPLLP